MTLQQITVWRNWTGRFGALLCAILALTLIDGLYAQFGRSPNAFELLPGESVGVNGPLKDELKGVDELSYVSTSGSIKLVFEGLHRGFWLGGAMWRGTLRTDPEIRPGVYEVKVSTGNQPENPMTVLVVRVYGNARSMHLDSKSFMLRHADVSPWHAALAALGLLLLTLGVVYLMSGQRERLLLREGMAEVYHIVSTEHGREIAFGLGTLHGVHAGGQVTLLDKSGRPLETVEVRAASERDAVARVSSECQVEPGTLVKKG